MEERRLEPKFVKAFLTLRDHLNHIADNVIGEPMDPKVEACLQMAADMIDEQVTMDKYYTWPGKDDAEETEEDSKESNPYLFLENEESDIPSTDDLENWFNGGTSKDDSDE